MMSTAEEVKAANGHQLRAALKRTSTPSTFATAKRMKADGHTVKDIATYLGVSRATLYRYLNAERAA